MVIVLALILLCFAGLAWLVDSGRTLSFDTSVLMYINDHATLLSDFYFDLVTDLGHPLITLPLGLVIAAILLRRRSFEKAAVITALFIGSGLATSVLKNVFERARPDLQPGGIFEATFSFPSGHATACMIITLAALYLVWSHRRLRMVLLVTLPLYVASISVSRLYLSVHYPTDILGGWLVAAGWFLFTLVVLRLARPRIRNYLR